MWPVAIGSHIEDVGLMVVRVQTLTFTQLKHIDKSQLKSTGSVWAEIVWEICGHVQIRHAVGKKQSSESNWGLKGKITSKTSNCALRNPLQHKELGGDK